MTLHLNNQNILHEDTLYNIKRNKYKTVCAQLAFANFTFNRMVMIFYRICNFVLFAMVGDTSELESMVDMAFILQHFLLMIPFSGIKIHLMNI
jgi:hypothetical protein